MAIDDTSATVDQARVSAALRSAMERLQTVTSGDVTVSRPVLHTDGQGPSATLSSPDGTLDLRVNDDRGVFSVHLISEGFPEHGVPGPIDTPVGVSLGADVINVPDADLRDVASQAVPLLLQAQREIGVPFTPPAVIGQAWQEAQRVSDAPSQQFASTQANGNVDFDEDGDPSEIPNVSSTPYAAMAERNASLAIGQAASTPTLADDGNASAARMAALGARGAGVSHGAGSLDPHQATQVAIAASATTHRRLREVHTMVDQVAAQRAAEPSNQTPRDGRTTRQDAPRYADRSVYVSPTTGTDDPAIGQG